MSKKTTNRKNSQDDEQSTEQTSNTGPPKRHQQFGYCRGIKFASGDKLDAEIAESLDGQTLIEVGTAKERMKEVLTKTHYDKFNLRKIAIESRKPAPYSTSFEYTRRLIEVWKESGGRGKFTFGQSDRDAAPWRAFIFDQDDNLIEMAHGTDIAIVACAAFLTAAKHNNWPIQTKKIVPSVLHWFMSEGAEKDGTHPKVHHETEREGMVTNQNRVLFTQKTKGIHEDTLKAAMILNCWELVPLIKAGEQNILGKQEPVKRRRGPRRAKC